MHTDGGKSRYCLWAAAVGIVLCNNCAHPHHLCWPQKCWSERKKHSVRNERDNGRQQALGAPPTPPPVEPRRVCLHHV